MFKEARNHSRQLQGEESSRDIVAKVAQAVVQDLLCMRQLLERLQTKRAS